MVEFNYENKIFSGRKSCCSGTWEKRLPFYQVSGDCGGLSSVQSLAINRFTPENDPPHCPVVIMLKYFVNIINMKLSGLLIAWQFLVCCGHCFWWESTGLKQI